MATIKLINQWYEVEWRNAGSFLVPVAPEYFRTEQEAREWCAERGLRIVAKLWR